MSVLSDFFESIDVDLPPKEAQDVVRARLPDAVRRSGLCIGCAEVPAKGVFIRVGVQAEWNHYDRELLVFLEGAVETGRAADDTLEVVLVDRLESVPALLERFPELERPVTVGPFLGVWRDREMWFCSHGASAVAWLKDRYGMA